MARPVQFRSWWLAGIWLIPVVFVSFCRPMGAKPVDAADVWARAQMLGQDRGLDPAFIYSIAYAESSFDAHADSGAARGIMQLTRDGWDRVRHEPYHNAWDWRANMAAAADYLALLRDGLKDAGHFSYPLLAAAYRYGPGAVQRSGYDIARLPSPTNRAYQALLAGTTPADLPSHRRVPVELAEAGSQGVYVDKVRHVHTVLDDLDEPAPQRSVDEPPPTDQPPGDNPDTRKPTAPETPSQPATPDHPDNPDNSPPYTSPEPTLPPDPPADDARQQPGDDTQPPPPEPGKPAPRDGPPKPDTPDIPDTPPVHPM